MIKYDDNINLKKRFDLSGHTALVTGSSRGIGRALAIGLAEFGAKVIVHGSRESEQLSSVLECVRKFNPASFSIVSDLSKLDSASEILSQISEVGESPDILVLNASLQFRTKWNEIDLQAMQSQMQVNFNSSLALMQGCFETMKAQNWGRIITIGSVQEFRPHPDMAVYAASKSAQENLVRNVAKQVAQFGITVNNIAPGVFATDRNEEALSNPEYAQKVTACIPSGKYAEPADAAGLAVLLASDAGQYITGVSIPVDAGLRLP